MDVVSYILSKNYTNETAIQFGGLKGASCQIKSVEKLDGQNIITFLWKNDNDETRETKVYVDDGTPIYVWEAGDHYNYGDLVIYTSCFYRCIQPNSDSTFDETKWNAIGSPDGNYDIVQNSSLLPSRFTPADRKIYYSIDERMFWLWTGNDWEAQQTVVQMIKLPIPSETYKDRIVQYVGESTNYYEQGYFYKCNYADPGIYRWEEIATQDDVDGLTEEQLNTLLALI